VPNDATELQSRLVGLLCQTRSWPLETLAMRSRLLTALAAVLVSSLLLACGADASSDGTTDPALTGTEPSEGTPPPSDLASAPVAAVPAAGTAVDPGAARIAGAGKNNGGGSSSGGSSSGGTPPDPNAGAGAPPTTTCTITKDGSGFFTRNSPKSSYVAYVPASYSATTPMRLIVGLHGCGDSAYNFATWGVNPYDSRATQQHIGISIGSRDGTCWSKGVDDDKILAAVDDISKCFWVHQKKVVVAGYSSGGEMAYRVGLQSAARFAGIIVEDSGLYAAGIDPSVLLANAAWKLHIAHRTHTADTTFPLALVKADWAKTTTAGFPLLTSETPGDHNGVSSDWVTWLIPQSAPFVAP
jgi:hypothetical protein